MLEKLCTGDKRDRGQSFNNSVRIRAVFRPSDKHVCAKSRKDTCGSSSELKSNDKEGWSQRGFTLIELLAVLAIISLCAAMLWPSVPVHGYRKLETAARGLADDLRLIRQAAITSGEPCRIDFYRYAQYYELHLPGKKQTVYLPEGICYGGIPSFAKSSAGLPFVHYNTLGNPSGGGTVILKSAKGDKLYIIVTPVIGRVRISSEPPLT